MIIVKECIQNSRHVLKLLITPCMEYYDYASCLHISINGEESIERKEKE